MIRNKKFVMILCGGLAISLVGIGIVYAALQATLAATYNVIRQNVMSWDIGFKPETITGEIVANNSDNVNCGTATATATTISGISPGLSTTGDKCSYTFTIQNNGSIPGKISAINITNPTGLTCTKNGSTMVCDEITYELHYDTYDGTSVALNDVIDAQTGDTPTEETVVLTITYTGLTVGLDDFTQSGFSYTLTYAQN